MKSCFISANKRVQINSRTIFITHYMLKSIRTFKSFERFFFLYKELDWLKIVFNYNVKALDLRLWLFVVITTISSTLVFFARIIYYDKTKIFYIICIGINECKTNGHPLLEFRLIDCNLAMGSKYKMLNFLHLKLFSDTISKVDIMKW